VKSFKAGRFLLFYGFSCSKKERFLRRFGAILVSKVFWEFLDKTGLTGFPNRPDRFPMSVERLNPRESV
jgi:hypothetical protein